MRYCFEESKNDRIKVLSTNRRLVVKGKEGPLKEGELERAASRVEADFLKSGILAG